MALFLWHEQRSVLASSVAGLTKEDSCNYWKSNGGFGENKTIIRIKFTAINKEYLSEIDYKSTGRVK